VLIGEPPAPPKRGQFPQSNFGPCLLWPNCCIDQDATWYKCRLRPRPHCARCGTSSPSPKGGTAPHFRPTFVVAKRLDGSRCHWVWRYGSDQATLCPQPPHSQNGHSPLQFSAISIVAKRWLISATAEHLYFVISIFFCIFCSVRCAIL